MSTESRALAASLLLLVDALFLGALLVIHVGVRRGHLAQMKALGVGAPAWPDVGGSAGAVAWAAAGAAALAAVVVRLRGSPLPPLFLLGGAVLAAALALRRIASTGAVFGVGRFGTLAHVLALVWVVHLLGAMVALERRRGPVLQRFLALQALFGVALAAMVL